VRDNAGRPERDNRTFTQPATNRPAQEQRIERKATPQDNVNRQERDNRRATPQPARTGQDAQTERDNRKRPSQDNSRQERRGRDDER
jgi:hypothetical protein